jgi:hypothetical protein
MCVGCFAFWCFFPCSFVSLVHVFLLTSGHCYPTVSVVSQSLIAQRLVTFGCCVPTARFTLGVAFYFHPAEPGWTAGLLACVPALGLYCLLSGFLRHCCPCQLVRYYVMYPCY